MLKILKILKTLKTRLKTMFRAENYNRLYVYLPFHYFDTIFRYINISCVVIWHQMWIYWVIYSVSDTKSVPMHLVSHVCQIFTVSQIRNVCTIERKSLRNTSPFRPRPSQLRLPHCLLKNFFSNPGESLSCCSLHLLWHILWAQVKPCKMLT